MSDQSELNFLNPATDKRMSHFSCKFSQLYCSPFFSVGMFGVFCTTDTLHITIRKAQFKQACVCVFRCLFVGASNNITVDPIVLKPWLIRPSVFRVLWIHVDSSTLCFYGFCGSEELEEVCISPMGSFVRLDRLDKVLLRWCIFLLVGESAWVLQELVRNGSIEEYVLFYVGSFDLRSWRFLHEAFLKGKLDWWRILTSS